MISSKNISTRNKYLLYGILFGFIFPVIALIIRYSQYGFNQTLTLITIDPLLWIIFSAPIILGLMSFLIGKKQSELNSKILILQKTELALMNSNKELDKNIADLNSKNAVLIQNQKTEKELELLENSIKEFSNIIERIGQFDLSVFVDPQLSNDTNNLAEVLSTSLFNLREMVSNLQSTLAFLCQAKDNMIRSSNSIIDGVKIQKQEIDKTVKKISELNNHIDVNNKNVHIISKSSESTNTKLRELITDVDNATEGMTIINESVHDVNKIISNLNNKTDKIDGVIKIITDISKQTKLLALNAAIEAARAGEYGKGFGIVASEVGNLSESTQKAVEEISNSIKSIKEDTIQTVEKMGISKSEVQKGITRMVELNAEIEVLGKDFNIMVNHLEQLTNENQDEYEISQEINSNLSTFENVCNSNLEIVSDISTSVNDLNTSMQNVKNIVLKFRLN